MAKNRYDDKFRASAVVMLEAAGWPDKDGALSQVSKHLRVPLTTLHRWAKGESNPVPSDVVTEKRMELGELLDGEVQAIFGEMGRKRIDATYRDLGTVAGILIDKLQLLNDKPTEISERTVLFKREGVTSIPEHLAPGATARTPGDEAL